MSSQSVGNPSIDSKATGKEICEQKDIESAHSRSSSSLRRASQKQFCLIVRYKGLRLLLCNLYEVILGTKLSLLIPLVPLAIVAEASTRKCEKTSFSISPIYIYRRLLKNICITSQQAEYCFVCRFGCFSRVCLV